MLAINNLLTIYLLQLFQIAVTKVKSTKASIYLYIILFVSWLVKKLNSQI